MGNKLCESVCCGRGFSWLGVNAPGRSYDDVFKLIYCKMSSVSLDLF